MKITDEQKRIVDVLVIILRHGKVNAVTGETIARLAGVDSRVVAEMAAYFYSKGLPIGAGSEGYFKTVGEAEHRAQYQREVGRGTKIIRKAVQGRKAQATIRELTLFEQQPGDAA